MNRSVQKVGIHVIEVTHSLRKTICGNKTLSRVGDEIHHSCSQYEFSYCGTINIQSTFKILQHQNEF